jgi:hypothetical protein
MNIVMMMPVMLATISRLGKSCGSWVTILESRFLIHDSSFVIQDSRFSIEILLGRGERAITNQESQITNGGALAPRPEAAGA